MQLGPPELERELLPLYLIRSLGLCFEKKKKKGRLAAGLVVTLDGISFIVAGEKV